MRRLLLSLLVLLPTAALHAEPLPGTKPLTRDGDLAAQMVEGIDKYLMRELEASVTKRKEYWKPDFSSVEAFQKSVEPNRQRLRKILGVVDERVPFTDLEYVGGPKTPSLVAETDLYKVHAVRWPVLPGVEGEGLLLEPKGKVVANVIALPHADWTPEMLAGLAVGVPKEGQYARRLAEAGCRVLVPTLIDRKDTYSGNPKFGKMTNQPHREFVYRMAYEMGRHIIGHEIQKVLAAVDWFAAAKDHPTIGVLGYGDGGMIALFAGALDPRIQVVGTAGYLGTSENLWQEPIDRNLFGYWREFGDAELIAMLTPRWTIMESICYPKWQGPVATKGRSGAAPGRLATAPAKSAFATVLRSAELTSKIEGNPKGRHSILTGIALPESSEGVSSLTIQTFLARLQGESDESKVALPDRDSAKDSRKDFNPDLRQKRQFDQLVAFTQKLMRDSDQRRQETFWNKLDYSSVEKYEASCQSLRKQLDEEVIGKLPAPAEPMNPRSRPLYDEPKWTGYEVTLDLYPDVFAYGILLLPKGMKLGEKRPVVVCQHGLEGRPINVVDPKKTERPYHAFGAQLADRGYIVYAPQNPYIGQDKFRVLQRKANPLGLSLFSFIVRQHERTLDWLATLPNVDADRMAFYGLSYGGKTAMRVPALVPRYCLSICSGDFNEWIWKNASVDFKGSYLFTGEYEMPEFNLGHTFNYAEMAALIAPRPFMVERGHDDGVGIDEWVALEYAKVRRLYSRLKLPEKTEIEFFAGVHEIHGDGTFRFLDKHLK
jgi:dienelactone hydrolase